MSVTPNSTMDLPMNEEHYLVEVLNTYLEDNYDDFSVKSRVGNTHKYDNIAAALHFALQLQPGLAKRELEEPNNSDNIHIGRDSIIIKHINTNTQNQ